MCRCGALASLDCAAFSDSAIHALERAACSRPPGCSSGRRTLSAQPGDWRGTARRRAVILWRDIIGVALTPSSNLFTAANVPSAGEHGSARTTRLARPSARDRLHASWAQLSISRPGVRQFLTRQALPFREWPLAVPPLLLSTAPRPARWKPSGGHTALAGASPATGKLRWIGFAEMSRPELAPLRLMAASRRGDRWRARSSPSSRCFPNLSFEGRATRACRSGNPPVSPTALGDTWWPGRH